MNKQISAGNRGPRPYFRKRAVPNAPARSLSNRWVGRGIATLAIAALVVFNVATPFAQASTIASNKVGTAMYGFVISNSSAYSTVAGVPTGVGSLKNGNVGAYPEGACIPTEIEVTNNDNATGDINISPIFDYLRTTIGITRLEGITSSVSGNPRSSVDNLNDFSYSGSDLTNVTNFTSSLGSITATITGQFANEDTGTTAVSASDQARHYNVVLQSVHAGETVYVLYCGRLGLDASQYTGSSLSLRLAGGKENVPIPVNQLLVLPSITINKTVVGGTATASDFTFNLSPDVNGHSGSYSIPAGSTSVTIDNVNPDGNFSVTENAVNGYTFSSGSGTNCTFTGSTAIAAVAAGKPATNATCNFTNTFNAPTTGNVTVTKVVVNDNGGTKVVSDFVLSVGNTTVTSGATNAFGEGTYTVAETGPAGYAGTFSGDCDAQTHEITVVAGHDYNCTITNDDIQPLLTVTKVVVNDDGGQLQVADFPLFVGNVSVTSGAQNGFDAGVYVISETGDAGYTGTISGDCDLQGSVTLAVGDVKSCTITNNDNPVIPQTGTITVTKIVDNTGGGTKQVADFPLFVNTTAVTSGTTTTFNTGSYVVSETGDANYSAAFSGDCDAKTGAITLAANQDLTCTITNTYIIPPPTDFDVSVVKTVSDNTPSVGDTITYTLVAANAGPADATDNVLTDVIPTGLTYVSDDGGVDTAYDSSTHTLTWTIGTLTSGQSVTLHVDATVDSGQEGQTITNAGSIPFNEELDTNPDNNSDSADLTVNRQSGCTSNCGGGGGGGGTPATGSISGTTYIDNNSNGAFDSGDTVLPGVVVFIDANSNGVLDSGETNTTTNSSGAFQFNGLNAGTYSVREVPPSGYTVTQPTPDTKYTVVLNNNTVADRNFGHVAGRVLGENTNVPQVAGATTELPRTGMGFVWMILLGSIAAFSAVSATRKLKADQE